MLMQKGKSVGMGTVTEGSNLHGHAIPQGYVKVIIVYIQPNTAPVFASSFDNEEMHTAGQFTAWPASYLNRIGCSHAKQLHTQVNQWMTNYCKSSNYSAKKI